MIQGDPEVILAHGAMQDVASLYNSHWRDAILATSLELAKVIVRFGQQLSADERLLLTHLGGGLVRADRELPGLGIMSIA